MKIAIIPSADLSYNSGSIIYAKNLLRYLHARGHEAYLLGSKMPDDLPVELRSYIRIAPELLEHPIIDDREVATLEYGKSLNAITDYLLQLHQESELDVIHAHYASFNSYAAYVVNGLTRVPYVISSFGRDMNLGYMKDKRIAWLIEQSLPQAGKIIVTDPSLGAKIAKAAGTRSVEDKLIEIPMPFDDSVLKEDARLPREVSGASSYICTVNSCFSQEKDIDTILRSFVRVKKFFPGKLVIAGQDDHPSGIHETRLRRLTEDLGLSEDVIFTGYLKRGEVGMLLKHSEALVDARLEGNFSSVLLEAMYTGTPVVASRNAASLKIIEDGINGHLFEPGDSNTLESKIELALSEPEQKRLRVQMNAWLEIGGKRYREENCFASTLSVLEEVGMKVHD
ncbi:glycosyltransferase family 4 protein [Paenibacillus chitinolyticus]|uniref:glycosyltransferase family 4 protein n=1 Tax=Paenibacillus chitinolyticus TaxID=79263 RepID=UPI0036D91392